MDNNQSTTKTTFISKGSTRQPTFFANSWTITKRCTKTCKGERTNKAKNSDLVLHQGRLKEIMQVWIASSPCLLIGFMLNQIRVTWKYVPQPPTARTFSIICNFSPCLFCHR